MTTVPRSSPKKNDTRRYSAWEWTRGYIALFLTLPFFPVMMLLSGRTLPAGITRKLLRAHQRYTSSHPMDFRIPPDTAIPVYMERWWRIPRNWALNAYFHIVRRSDDDRALHDHPWWNFSCVLDGGYFEHEIMEGGVHRRTWYGPGAMRFRWHGTKAHRLELKATLMRDAPMRSIREEMAYDPNRMVELPVTTIFLTGPVLRRWGFHHPSQWVDAYDWDAFCEANGVKGRRMDGGSDAVVSERNKI